MGNPSGYPLRTSTTVAVMDGTPPAEPGADTPTGPARTGSPRSRRLLLALVPAAVVVVLVLVTDQPVLTVIAAVLVGVLILRVGWFFLQQFATPPPPPPDPGTLRKVKLTYRCPVCGAEVRMTSAASEDPEPPRHCMEEMELIATVDDAL